MIASIASRYDVFLIDMWGTIFDRGIGLYPKAAECLRQLVALGRTVILTSNAARRAESELNRQLGDAAADVCHSRIITAGEVLRSMVRDDDGFKTRYGSRYYTLGHCRNRGLLDDLDLSEVEDIRNASFVVVAGLAHPDDATSYRHPVFEGTRVQLAEALVCGIPLFVAKTDSLTALADGTAWVGPGPLVQWYGDLGGAVHFVGKPAASFYGLCRRYFSAAASRVLAIGDHRETDILGGASCGFHTLLVRSGLEARLAGAGQPRKRPSQRANIDPTYEAETLEW